MTDPYLWDVSADSTCQSRHAAWDIEAVIQARPLSLAWALMSLPPMFRTCLFLIIASAS
jgi:hypothetical protein